MIRTTAAALAALLLSAGVAFAADDAAARLTVAKELIQFSGAMQNYNGAQVSEAMVRQIKRSMPMLDEAALGEVQKIAKEEYDAGGPALAGEMAKMYAQHFSEADLKAMVAFYKSDAGQHLAAATPVLVQEGAQISSGITAKIMDRFRSYLMQRVSGKPQQ